MVIATDRGIVWTDSLLRPTHEVPLVATPVAMSTGVDDAVYVLCRDPNELLAFDTHGHERYRVPLEGEVLPFPPAVDPGHGVVVAQGDRVVALDEGGAMRWTMERDSRTPVAVDASGNSLVADGTAVRLVGRTGVTAEVWRGTEALLSAPVVVDAGTVAFVTAQSVYVLGSVR